MTKNYELEEAYQVPLRAFDLWMKQAGYTLTTQKEYNREIFSYLATLNGKAPQDAGKMDVIGFLVMKQGKVGDRHVIELYQQFAPFILHSLILNWQLAILHWR